MIKIIERKQFANKRATTTTTKTKTMEDSSSSSSSIICKSASTGLTAAAPDTEWKACASFDDMQLRTEVLRGIYSAGYERPTSIQERAIRPASEGRDVIMQAQSGTGKTATFSIAVLQQLDTSLPHCQAILLSPTRELALQTHRVVSSLGSYMSLKAETAIGGTPKRDDQRRLRKGCHVLCATPGRVYDLLQDGTLSATHVRMFVVDEVDVMLAEGFVEQVKGVFDFLPSTVQAMAVSATVSPESMRVADQFLRDPVKILLDDRDVPLKGILQHYVDCQEERYKYSALADLFKTLSVAQSVIFTNSKQRAEHLAEQMRDDDFCVSVMHGDMTQEERNETLRVFSSGCTRVLIATDVVSHGIDVQQVSVVVNYDMPLDNRNYLHRIGRCGRFARKGLAINLVTARTAYRITELEQAWSHTISELPMDIASLL
jgi:translation initiation factor 4A